MKKYQRLLILPFLLFPLLPADADARIVHGYHAVYAGESWSSDYKSKRNDEIIHIYFQKLQTPSGSSYRLSAFERNDQNLLTDDVCVRLLVDETEITLPPPVKTPVEIRLPFHLTAAAKTADIEITADIIKKIAGAQKIALTIARQDEIFFTAELPESTRRDWIKIIGTK